MEFERGESSAHCAKDILLRLWHEQTADFFTEEEMSEMSEMSWDLTCGVGI
jgi:hypothetical protein